MVSPDVQVDCSRKAVELTEHSGSAEVGALGRCREVLLE
jgi:hypothetical protein